MFLLTADPNLNPNHEASKKGFQMRLNDTAQRRTRIHYYFIEKIHNPLEHGLLFWRKMILFPNITVVTILEEISCSISKAINLQSCLVSQFVQMVSTNIASLTKRRVHKIELDLTKRNVKETVPHVRKCIKEVVRVQWK